MDYDHKSAIDMADSLYEYLSINATSELQQQYKTFYNEFVEWNVQRDKIMINARQSVTKLVEEYFNKKEFA